MCFPTFRPNDLLSEWSNCFLEIRCGKTQEELERTVEILAGIVARLSYMKS